MSQLKTELYQLRYPRGILALWPTISPLFRREAKAAFHVFGVTSLLSFNEDRHLIASDGNGNLAVFETWRQNVKAKQKARVHTSKITKSVSRRVSTWRDDIVALTCSNDAKLKLSDVSAGIRESMVFEGHSSFVTGCSTTSASKSVFASCSIDRSICLWDRNMSAHAMAIMTGEPIRSVDFLPNQLYLLLTSQANSILVWDIRNTKVYKEFIHINQSSVPDNVVLDQEVDYLDLVSDVETIWGPGNPGLWSQSTDQEDYEEPFVSFQSLWKPQKAGISPQSIRAQAHQGNVHLSVPDYHGLHCFSTSSDNTLKIWNIFDQECVRTLVGAQLEPSCRPTLSSAGTCIVAGGSDGVVSVWDTSRGLRDDDAKPTVQRKLHSFPVTSVALSDDETKFFSADEGGTISMLDMTFKPIKM